MSYNYSSYQSTSNADTGRSDSDFSRLSNQISSNVQKISQNVNQMKKMVNELGTPSDSHQLQTSLHDLHRVTNQLVRETNNHLKELSQMNQTFTPEQKQRRMLMERLMNNFSEVLKNFQVVQRTAAQKERDSVSRARANSGLKQFDENPNLIDLETGPGHQTQMHLQMEEDIDVNLLKEREQSIKKIEGDIIEVNQIFRDLATMVHEQGEVIDSIESVVERATINVSEGAQQISKAKDYQTAARRRKLYLLMILSLIAFFLVFIIYISNK